MEYSLIVDSINKSFGSKKILSDVYLKCEIGDIIGVFGRNGCGKSTLLKIIYGTLPAQNKHIKLNNTFSNTPYSIAQGILYLPQKQFIPNYFKVKKAIKLFLNPNKQADFENDVFIQKIIHAKIAELSGGELKYLELKLILFSDSKFCLLDEPYSGVSPIMALMINQLILSQSKEKGIIITDHNYTTLLDIVTKIYLVANGAGKFLKNKEDLVAHDYLKNNML